MSERNFKTLRKQARNIIQELIPSLLQNELVDAVHKKLAESINTKLNKMNTSVEAQLKEIQDRQKDIQAYVVSRLGTAESSSLTKDAQ